MSHNEKRESWKKEAIAGLIGGIAYGLINTIVGHPMDTIKTNMQIDIHYKGKNMIQSMIYLYKNKGLIGFYKGVYSPILGSSIYRSAQFSVFEGVYTFLDEKRYPKFCYKIPFSFGLEIRVLIAAFFSGTARSILECPFEYSKVNMQIGQNWEIKKIYQGFQSLYFRTIGLMIFAFALIDSFRRNTNAYNNPISCFFIQGGIASLSFILIWPLEIAKNQIQGMKNSSKNNTNIYQIIKLRYKDYGLIQGLYRGVLPGVSGIFMRNGASMIGMIEVQKLLSYYGFRK